jgi:hypothetical protein
MPGQESITLKCILGLLLSQLLGLLYLFLLISFLTNCANGIIVWSKTGKRTRNNKKQQEITDGIIKGKIKEDPKKK